MGLMLAACEYNPNLLTYLRITDISEDGKFIEEGKKSVNHPDVLNYILEEGDIVFARTGNSTGKTYLYDSNDGALVFAGFLIRFKPLKGVLHSQFIKFFTETNYYKNWVELYSARTGQ
jgi:type I restriction enzyme S subunit